MPPNAFAVIFSDILHLSVDELDMTLTGPNPDQEAQIVAQMLLARLKWILGDESG